MKQILLSAAVIIMLSACGNTGNDQVNEYPTDTSGLNTNVQDVTVQPPAGNMVQDSTIGTPITDTTAGNSGM